MSDKALNSVTVIYYVQADLAKSFHRRLLPLKEAIDEVKANGLDTVYQQLTSVITQYRFAFKS